MCWRVVVGRLPKLVWDVDGLWQYPGFFGDFVSFWRALVIERVF
jgi:hypothetical protein